MKQIVLIAIALLLIGCKPKPTTVVSKPTPKVDICTGDADCSSVVKCESTNGPCAVVPRPIYITTRKKNTEGPFADICGAMNACVVSNVDCRVHFGSKPIPPDPSTEKYQTVQVLIAGNFTCGPSSPSALSTNHATKFSLGAVRINQSGIH